MKTTGYNSLTSWLTLMACSVVAFFIAMPMRLAGLFFVILLDGYDTDRKKASIPIVIFGILRTLTGPFTAILGETFGFRTVTLTGCVLGAVGMGCCFFAEDITTATICLGFVYGMGLAFGCTLMQTILKLHFTEHINLVNGIWFTGTCAGAIVMSPVITFLQNTYGMNGMFLIVGGMFLNTIPAAIILKHPHNDRRIWKAKPTGATTDPRKTSTFHQNLAYISDEENQSSDKVKTPIQSLLNLKIDGASGRTENAVKDSYSNESLIIEMKNKEKTNPVSMVQQDTDDATQYCINKILSKQTCSSFSPDIKLMRYIERQSSFKKTAFENDFLPGKTTVNNLTHAKKREIETSISKAKVNWRSFKLFTDPTYYLIMTVQSVHAFVTTLNWTIIVDYGRDKGMSTEKSVYFVMFLPVAEIFGNMCLNWVTDNHFMTRTNFCLTCFLILVLDAGYIMWTYDFVLMMIGVLIFGFVSGALATTFPGIIIEQIEEEQLNMALASRLSLYAFLCVLKTPIIGYFRGTLGSYDWVYCIIMACSLTCCILAKLTPILASYRKGKKELKENT